MYAYNKDRKHAVTEQATISLNRLLLGHQRFISGRPEKKTYSISELESLSEKQAPIAGIVCCSDSRVGPEIIFDQPLGTNFSSRVPGNVASDSAKWMLDIAINEFHVPLVMVVGHTGCLAVGQLPDGDRGGAGGALIRSTQSDLSSQELNPS